MLEVDIGIGRSRRILGGIEQELLLWFDVDGNAYPTSDEIIESKESELIAERQKAQAEKRRADVESQKAEAEKQRADAERQKTFQLAEYLRSLGVDPDNLPKS